MRHISFFRGVVAVLYERSDLQTSVVSEKCEWDLWRCRKTRSSVFSVFLTNEISEGVERQDCLFSKLCLWNVFYNDLQRQDSLHSPFCLTRHANPEVCLTMGILITNKDKTVILNSSRTSSIAAIEQNNKTNSCTFHCDLEVFYR